ncbi:hypothetical protein [Arsenicicoccus dermatophilus]|uniref:YobI family P-loop NTPase n=1 Tax=Arsenicicoccus dermatophilus TaxID=1076331 RepID=UPI001F4C6E0B|nr:hypothetical protein [Arsenicicoccus dermatophilus]MCH8614401.1 hypothetical protein [Arsenicicoccus dermatophilus]
MAKQTSVADEAVSDGPRPNGEAPLDLRPLTPEYQEAQHSVYVEQLIAALQRGDVRRIALTGQYGTGKSSILKGLKDRPQFTKLKPVTVSLATIDATTASERPDAPKEASPGDVTNLIQKEVVKQLLHVQHPARAPLSRYRRASRPRVWHLVLQVLLMASTTALVSAAILKKGPLTWSWTPVIAAALVAGFVLWFYRTHLSGRFLLSELKAGTGSGSLALTNQATWFDEHLAEIMYFFDSSDCRLVIFEDIDRFEDARIFDTLRDLNTLLNNADQLKRPDKSPIRFLYAIRDSVFTPAPVPAADDSSDADNAQTPGPLGDASSPAARRVKYFDYILSVVPFVTPRSSRDHFTELLTGAGLPQGAVPGDQVVSLVSKHITDYRLITSVVNDYQVFHQLVLHESNLELRADNLFALVAYKNTQPADFEKILAGDSKLNHLYTAHRKVIDKQAAALDDLAATLDHPQKVLDLPAEQREHLGRALTLTLKVSYDFRYTGGTQASAGDMVFSADKPADPGFWAKAVEEGVTLQRTGLSDARISPGELAALLGLPDDESTWTTEHRKRIENQRTSLDTTKERLRSATLAQALAHEPAQQTTDPEVRAALDGADGLDEAVERLRLDDLTMSLLRQGFIDRYFTLYAARYQATRLTASALNFVMVVVDNPHASPDLRYRFDEPDRDVPAVLAEAGPAFLDDQRVLNVQIFNHILDPEHDWDALRPAKVAASATEEAQRFRDLYLHEGAHRDEFIAWTAPHWTTAFTTLAAQDGDDALRRHQMNIALRNASPATPYSTDSAVTQFLRKNLHNLEAIDHLGDENVDQTAAVLDMLGHDEDDLTKLPENLADVMVARNRYTVTTPNLEFLTGYSTSPGDVTMSSQDRFALDRIRADARPHVIQHLVDYEKVLREHPATRSISQVENVPTVLNMVAEANREDIKSQRHDILFERVATDRLELSELDSLLWPAAARTGLAPLTLTSLAEYQQKYPAMKSWVKRLADPKLQLDPTDVDPDPDAFDRVYVAILRLKTLTPERRADLLSQAGVRLAVDVLDEETHEMIPLLVKRGVLPDSAQTYEAARQGGPDVLEKFVDVSEAPHLPEPADSVRDRSASPDQPRRPARSTPPVRRGYPGHLERPRRTDPPQDCAKRHDPTCLISPRHAGSYRQVDRPGSASTSCGRRSVRRLPSPNCPGRRRRTPLPARPAGSRERRRARTTHHDAQAARNDRQNP